MTGSLKFNVTFWTLVLPVRLPVQKLGLSS